jgi:hypothetical protein
LTPIAALCVFLFISAGCSPSKGTVSGLVKRQGKPIVWGNVTLIASDNAAYSGPITSQGTYSIPNVPGGPVKLCVTSTNPDGAARGGPAAERSAASDRAAAGANRSLPPAGAWIAIPDKYTDPQQSGLTGTVKGDTTIDLDLD